MHKNNEFKVAKFSTLSRIDMCQWNWDEKRYSEKLSNSLNLFIPGIKSFGALDPSPSVFFNYITSHTKKREGEREKSKVKKRKKSNHVAGVVGNGWKSWARELNESVCRSKSLECVCAASNTQTLMTIASLFFPFLAVANVIAKKKKKTGKYFLLICHRDFNGLCLDEKLLDPPRFIKGQGLIESF